MRHSDVFNLIGAHKLTLRVMSWLCARGIIREGTFEKHRIVNSPLEVCTTTNIEGYVMPMYSPDKSTSEDLKAALKHNNVNIPLDVCTNTSIEGYVMPMYSPDKSTSENVKSIIET